MGVSRWTSHTWSALVQAPLLHTSFKSPAAPYTTVTTKDQKTATVISLVTMMILKRVLDTVTARNIATKIGTLFPGSVGWFHDNISNKDDC